MKKTVKRVVSLGLVLVLSFSMAACKKDGDSNGTTKAKESTKKTLTYEKPSSVTVMWDGTILKETEEAELVTDALYKAYDEAYGMKITWVRPDHSKYAEYVSQAFASGDVPDVLMLSADNYATYAAKGVLYDFKEDWEASDIREDGRFSQLALDVIETYYVEGRNGELGLYGLPTVRGNGCVTYVRKSWLDAIGKKAEDIKTYDDYYNALVAMKSTLGKDYVVTAAGYITNEAPYVNYLPEFWQDAYPDFIQKDGKWVDGFTQPEMKAALDRLTKAYAAGLLDPAMGENGTSQARNNFIENKAGVVTYWAGTWMNTLTVNISNKDKTFALDENGQGDVVALKPIAEVGKYFERQGPAICITKDANNAAGIYKYFIEPIFDGGAVQSVWMYGAKGAQWDNKAETITFKGKDYTYAEGQFHFKLNKKASNWISKNNIDPLLAFCSYKEGQDPANGLENITTITKLTRDCQVMFDANSTPAPAIKSTSVVSAVKGEIMDKRKQLAQQVIQGLMSYDEAMADYEKEMGQKVTACLDSLNEE